jgi:F-type H+-transporting ATPase subunit b
VNLLATLLGADPARSIHWLWPELKEIIWGVPASLVIFFALYKFGGPPMKKAMAARTERIREQLDGAAAAKVQAEAEATEIRRAAGDIEAERARLFAEADAQAEALLSDGRARLDAELAELQARADAEIASTSARAGDELRAEISRLANAATERMLGDGAIDDALQQDLIENFIQKVGAAR